jgi:hypothetical protein
MWHWSGLAQGVRSSMVPLTCSTFGVPCFGGDVSIPLKKTWRWRGRRRAAHLLLAYFVASRDVVRSRRSRSLVRSPREMSRRYPLKNVRSRRPGVKRARGGIVQLWTRRDGTQCDDNPRLGRSDS